MGKGRSVESLYDEYLNIVKVIYEDKKRKDYLMNLIEEALRENPDLYEDIYSFLLKIYDSAQVESKNTQVYDSKCISISDKIINYCNYIKPLLKSNKIRLSIPDKPRSSKQKYVSIK